MFNRNRTSDNPTYDLPNMAAVKSESKPYTDPNAKYPIAQAARDAQTQGTQRRR